MAFDENTKENAVLLLLESKIGRERRAERRRCPGEPRPTAIDVRRLPCPRPGPRVPRSGRENGPEHRERGERPAGALPGRARNSPRVFRGRGDEQRESVLPRCAVGVGEEARREAERAQALRGELGGVDQACRVGGGRHPPGALGERERERDVTVPCLW